MNWFSFFQQPDYYGMVAAQQQQFAAIGMQFGLRQANDKANLCGEADLLSLLHQGVLNRDEFVAASATQNEIQRLLAEYKSDGFISCDEHEQLAKMRMHLQLQLRQFAAGDCKPETSMDHPPNRQAGELFDLVKAGKLSPQAVASIRELMAQSAASGRAWEGQVDFALKSAAQNRVVHSQRLGEQQFAAQVQLLSAAPGLGWVPFYQAASMFR